MHAILEILYLKSSAADVIQKHASRGISVEICPILDYAVYQCSDFEVGWDGILTKFPQ